MILSGVSPLSRRIVGIFASGSRHAGDLATWTKSRLRTSKHGYGAYPSLDPHAPRYEASRRSFNHACRYELFNRNPMRFVRQGSKRRSAPNVLTAAEIKALVDHLPLRERYLVLLAAATGLRQSELYRAEVA